MSSLLAFFALVLAAILARLSYLLVLVQFRSSKRLGEMSGSLREVLDGEIESRRGGQQVPHASEGFALKRENGEWVEKPQAFLSDEAISDEVRSK